MITDTAQMDGVVVPDADPAADNMVLSLALVLTALIPFLY
jgi:hypothetical protein